MLHICAPNSVSGIERSGMPTGVEAFPALVRNTCIFVKRFADTFGSTQRVGEVCNMWGFESFPIRRYCSKTANRSTQAELQIELSHEPKRIRSCDFKQTLPEQTRIERQTKLQLKRRTQELQTPSQLGLLPTKKIKHHLRSV